MVSTFMIGASMGRWRLILSVILGMWGVMACTAVSPFTHLVPTPIVVTTALPTLSTPTLNVPSADVTLTQSVSTQIATSTAATPVAESTLTPVPTLTRTPTPVPDTGWELLRPGFEWREIRLQEPLERIYLVRLEPDLYRVTIGYHPGQPQSLTAWQTETGALLLVNGGFFTEEMVATGRMVVDGVASGVSYAGFGGMLAIGDGFVEVRSLVERPYDPHESLQYALQAFPMLVQNGEVGFPDETGRRARRTVVAMDVNGRLLFIVASQGRFTLHELSKYLVESNLELDMALNLDGGPSTGLLLADPVEEISAYGRLPAVIAIYPQQDE